MSNGSAMRSWVLNSETGWRDAARVGLLVTDRALGLNRLPGKATPLRETSGGPLELACPSAIAGNCRHGLFLVDAATSNVIRLQPRRRDRKRSSDDWETATPVVDLVEYRTEVLPTVGGPGIEPRRLHEPRGLAILPSGALAVADTRNHRVQIFSAAPLHALLHVWGATSPLGDPVAGTGPKEFHLPWALAADPAGTLYVVDRGNHRIQAISEDGTWLGEIGALALSDPTRIAVGTDRTLAIIDQAQSVLLLFQPGRVLPRALAGVDSPTCVAFAPDGNLYVGDRIGRLHLFTRADGFRLAGSGVTGLDGAVVDLFWDSAHDSVEAGAGAAESPTPRLLAIIQENIDGHRRTFWTIDPSGGCAVQGQVVTQALDSQIDRCQWHRILLDATVPEGTSLEIESYTADPDVAGSLADRSEGARPENDPTHPEFSRWKRCVLVGDKGADQNPDCLVQSEAGRYLWLRLTLRSNGVRSPELRSLMAFFPRASHLQHLPAVYQEDEDSRRFLDRFLSIFQSGFDDFDRRIDQIADLFDPDRVPSQYLRWLSGWLALVVEPSWGEATREAKLRDLLKNASTEYARRGTVHGLQRTIEEYAEVRPVKILEHFRLRRWAMLSQSAALDGTAPLWSRHFYQRLQVTSYSQVGFFRLTGRPEPAIEALEWGAHRFSVFFPANPYDVDEARERVARVVKREKPAHTEAVYCPVLPRMRVGVQASVGVDSMVGAISHLVLNRLATLNYDTILACSQTEQTMRALGTALRPRAGVTTRLP